MDELISRQAAIDALKKDMASLDHIIKGMSANDVRLDAYVSQRNQVNYDIYTINNLPPAELGTNLAEVGTDCIRRQAAIDLWEKYHPTIAVDAMQYDAELRQLPPIQPKRGQWIDVDVMGVPAQACDQCNTFFPLAYTGGGHHYCPNCGAKMEVTE